MIKKIYETLIIIKSGLFDRHYYLKTYRDVRKADIDPLWHFIKFGWKEGRNPSENFDVEYYLESNRDIKISGMNPLLHFILYGREEGRLPHPSKKNEPIPIGFQQDDKQNKVNIPVYQLEVLKQESQSLIADPLADSLPIDYPNQNIIDISGKNLQDLNIYKEKISVIIPTKDAGSGFEHMMKMLTSQLGFTGIEIIIVDSGSQDKTLQISNRYNAKVIEIPPKDFSHSFARNLGAKNASGEYLFFTVQDAIIPTITWLHTLMTKLKTSKADAVSCAELPKEDADLFYRVISWNHYEFLEVNQSDRILSLPPNPDQFSLRKNGQLSDIACLIPSELFNKYLYRFSYAEDLDLGLRLIKDGYKLLFLGSTRIIHSHNRDPYYFLKRGFVDNIFLSEIFSDFAIPESNFIDASQDISFTYYYLNTHIFPELSKINSPIELLPLKNLIMESLNLSSSTNYPKTINFNKKIYKDTQLISFIKQLLDTSDYKKAGSLYDGNITKSLMGFVNITFQYLQQSTISTNKSLVEDLQSCLMKEASILFGAKLAHAYLNKSQKQEDKYSLIYSKLRENV